MSIAPVLGPFFPLSVQRERTSCTDRKSLVQKGERVKSQGEQKNSEKTSLKESTAAAAAAVCLWPRFYAVQTLSNRLLRGNAQPPAGAGVH